MSSCLVLNKEDIYISLQDTIDVGAEQGPAATIVIQEGIKKLIDDARNSPSPESQISLVK